jgi:hypothetical protein
MATTAAETMKDGDVEDELYRLIEVAERQQEAAQGAVDALAAERAAFAKERETWSKGVPSLKDDVRLLIAQAVAGSANEAAKAAADAVGDGTKELREAISAMTTRANQAEESLRAIAGWASKRLLLWGLSAIAALMLVPSIMLWWERSAIEAAQVEKAQLLAGVAELRANRDTWVKAGMLGEIRRCGASKRACIKVDESAGAFGDRSEYRVIATN